MLTGGDESPARDEAGEEMAVEPVTPDEPAPSAEATEKATENEATVSYNDLVNKPQ
jgi:hypothetical protein